MKQVLLPKPTGVRLIFLFAAFIVTFSAQAQTTINVTCDTGSLITAVNTANGTPEADTLNLAANCNYNFASAADIDGTIGDSALPRVTTQIIINGNGATIARASGNPDFRLLYVTETGSLTLYHIIMTGGDGGSYSGGAIHNTGTLTVTGSTVSGNSASSLNGHGGGIYNASGGTATLTDSTVSSNFAYSGGGGIVNLGTLTMTGSNVSGNMGNNSSGAGIVNGGTLTVTNSIISGNSDGHQGGGIWNLFGTLTVTNSTLSGNSAATGGGIYNYAGTLTVTNSTLLGNTANYGGGIYNFGGSSTLTVTNSTLSGNTALDGGGIRNDGGTLTVTNSTLSGNNNANFGGGIYNDGTATVTNSTLSGNAAGIDGGGIAQVSGTMTVTNSIVWGNDSQIAILGGDTTVTFSDIQDGFAGTGNLNADPLFVGAVSHTLAPTSAGDYHIQSGSPVINAGSNASLPANSLDRDGNPRISGGIADMGAYEFKLIDLINGGFETAGATNAIPASWTVKNATGDKRLCRLGKPHTGLCAFKFLGSIGEKAQLSQTVDLSGVTLSEGDTLTLMAFFKGNNATAKVKFILSVTYGGNPTPVKSSIIIKQNAIYTLHALPAMPLGTGTVEAIKVTFKHRSTAGKVLIDDVNLIHTPLGGRRSADVLPLPLPPDGFRGGN